MTALATNLAAMLDFVPLLGVADWRATDGKEVTLTSVLPCRMYRAACARMVSKAVCKTTKNTVELYRVEECWSSCMHSCNFASELCSALFSTWDESSAHNMFKQRQK